MNHSRIIAKNVVLIWVSRVLLLLPQIILLPFLINSIGVASYGTYTLLWSLLMSLIQLQTSLQSGVVKFTSEFLANNQTRDVNRVASASLVFSLLLAGLITLALVIVVFLNPDAPRAMKVGYLIMTVATVFIYPATVYMGVIQGLQRVYISALLDAIFRCVGVGAVIVWFALIGPSFDALLLILVSTLILSRLIQIPIAYRLVPTLSARFREFNWSSFRSVAIFGSSTAVASLCLVLNSTGIRWMLGFMVSTTFVAHLAIVLMPGLLLTQIIGSATVVLMPVASAFAARGDQVRNQELFVNGVRYSMIIVVIVMIFAWFLTPSILQFWVGSEFEFLSPYALVLLATSSLMQSTSAGHHILKGLGEIRIIVGIYFVGLVVVPFGMILLALRILGDPYVATVVGLGTGQVVTGLLQLYFSTKALKVSYMDLLWRGYGQLMLLAAPSISVCVIYYGFSSEPNIGLSLSLSIFAAFIFLILCYFVGFSKIERQQLKLLFRRTRLGRASNE